MKGAAGVCLLPLILASCDGGKLEIHRALRSPDQRLLAVSSYQNNGPMVSDDARVQIFRLTSGKLIEPCWAYRGEYGRIGPIRWSGNSRLDIDYERGHLASISTQCSFSGEPDRTVEIVPHPIEPS